MNIEEIYRYLQENLTNARLQEMSLQIIAAYKAKNYAKLQSLSEFIFAKSADHPQSNKLFLNLIKYFHPDRLKAISNEITAAYRQHNLDKLEFYKRMLTVHKDTKERYSQRHAEPSVYSERQEFNEHDFGFGMNDDSEEYDDYTVEVDAEMDFIAAVKAELMGNLDMDFDLGDLEMLDGELNLANYGIADLNGLEYCQNIINLNLSNNEIDDILEVFSLTYLQELYLADNQICDIDGLKHLWHLEILDLSGNRITDISSLHILENLKFVDLRNNPLRDHSAIEKLLSRGVNVIYD